MEDSEDGAVPEQKSRLCREGLLRTVREGILYLAGADRRGTIYAIYDFCQWMGVSPWYFWRMYLSGKRKS